MVLLLLSVALASSARAESNPTGKPTPAVVAVAEEPAILKKIIAAHWKLANARAALPPVQVVHKEQLETQDWIEYAYDGGALRLYVSPGPKGGDIFGVLVDTRNPRYKNFVHPFFAEHYAVYHHGSYAVVLPLRPVSQQVFDTMKSRRWTEQELETQLGGPSYHWHLHGIGWWGLTLVPQGLSFIGDVDGPNSPVRYQVYTSEWEKQHQNSLELPPLAFPCLSTKRCSWIASASGSMPPRVNTRAFRRTSPRRGSVRVPRSPSSDTLVPRFHHAESR